ncbi:MAG: hypothetical protein JNJ40_00325 [Bacteroidia bacterium]|nr:hypothetical protein [Bacteroidia bacterium]
MRKAFACLLILVGTCIIIYALMVLIKCFSLLSSTEFNSAGIGYSLGTLLGPLILLAIARWFIRKGVKVYKQETNIKKK